MPSTPGTSVTGSSETASRANRSPQALEPIAVSLEPISQSRSKLSVRSKNFFIFFLRVFSIYVYIHIYKNKHLNYKEQRLWC